jgi:hypothetical protein
MTQNAAENLKFEKDKYGQAIPKSVHDNALKHLGFDYNPQKSQWYDEANARIISREKIAESLDISLNEIIAWEQARDEIHESEWRDEIGAEE